jgi:Zn-dependent peptidase ImmA (M78 family)
MPAWRWIEEKIEEAEVKVVTEESLAAEILMPEALLRKHIVISREELQNIADQFRVTPEAAMVRLRELGYTVPYGEIS